MSSYVDTEHNSEPADLMGIGLGPFNLSLAALAHEYSSDQPLRYQFIDQRDSFSWHPGLLLSDAVLQVPFLADLVTLVRPTSQWSFLNYLHQHQRMFPFYFAEDFHILRAEYNDYLTWASRCLPHCEFGTTATRIEWSPHEDAFAVQVMTRAGAERRLARNLALGVGTTPHIPEVFAPAIGHGVLHSSDFLAHREQLSDGPTLVVGAGQSGAEVYLDLLRSRPVGHENLYWVARSPHFAPMEYSKLGLEQFTPDYTDFFRDLPPDVRGPLFADQWQLYKAASADTLGAIHHELYRRSIGGQWPRTAITAATEVIAAQPLSGSIPGTGGIEVTLRNRQQQRTEQITVSNIVLATGYRQCAFDDLAAGIDAHIQRDGAGTIVVDANQRLMFDDAVAGRVYVQNVETATHGVGVPDLGLASWRSAVILNDIAAQRDPHCPAPFPLPERTAFTAFGLDAFTRHYRSTATASTPSPLTNGIR